MTVRIFSFSRTLLDVEHRSCTIECDVVIYDTFYLYQLRLYIVGGVVAELIMVFGYFIAKYILKGSWIVAASEILANVVQGAAGIVIALIAYPMVKKIVQDKLN